MGVKVKGIRRVRSNINLELQDIANNRTPRVLAEVAITGAKYAALLTPIKSSTLINSQYRQLYKLSDGYEARVGYTANYAAAVNTAKGTLKGKPRPDGSGNYWDPNAEPDFLRKGFEVDGAQEIQEVIRRGYKI